uniref:Uncharacterized protein n=1 Tax=Trypanosoma vivax (strain Y486) TaxID=1055687 RepID=G0U0L6_TRYVY|nr:hypothetical protein TVY486_0802240 [Trypanosoma vivax Y486]
MVFNLSKRCPFIFIAPLFVFCLLVSYPSQANPFASSHSNLNPCFSTSLPLFPHRHPSPGMYFCRYRNNCTCIYRHTTRTATLCFVLFCRFLLLCTLKFSFLFLILYRLPFNHTQTGSWSEEEKPPEVVRVSYRRGTR